VSERSPHRSLGELRADVARERERRYWTIEQNRRLYGDEWPSGVAGVQRDADAAVDGLFEQLETAETALSEIIHLPDETQAYSYADACVMIARRALDKIGVVQ
jgi:hypothetical protein